MSLYFFFCVLWAYFVVTGGMSTNRGLQQAKFEEWRPAWDGDTALHTGYYSELFRSGRKSYCAHFFSRGSLRASSQHYRAIFLISMYFFLLTVKFHAVLLVRYSKKTLCNFILRGVFYLCAKFGFNSVIQFHEISIFIFKLTTDSQFHPAPHNVELRERAIYLVR